MRKCVARAGRSAVVAIAALALSGSTLGGSMRIETVLIDAPGNAADTNGLGAVADAFRIGRFEVTNTAYAGFLNAVADDDPGGLYNTLMSTSDRGGIDRFGAPGSYTYIIKPGFDDKPVGGVTWPSAARFCNWLHNGQPTGAQGPATTENGAYDMSQPNGLITRQAGATWFLPTHDQWYKAAYHDPDDAGADGGGTPDYWLYPTKSDAAPAEAEADAQGDVVNPGANVANHSGGADWNGENGNVTTVGGCQAPGPWGTHDMGGNVLEWTDDLGTPIPANPPDQPEPLPTRISRGGDFSNSGLLMSSLSGFALDLNMLGDGINVGFRVATTAGPAADLDGDGIVGFVDLVILLGSWGPCPVPPDACGADLDGDGAVGFTDLSQLLAAWTI